MSFMDYVNYVQNVGDGAIKGAGIGAAVSVATLAAVGLSVAGPTAGGLFALKMGAALSSGGYAQ